MRWIYRSLTSFALCASILTGLAGCGGRAAETAPPQTGQPASPEQDKITVQMYGYLDATYLPFLDSLQESFPGISLEYEFQWDEAGYNEAERRILHGDGPDLFVVRGMALSSMSDKNLLLDLTNEDFSTRYHVSTMTEINDKGKIYGLPLPNDIRCLICNLDILAENNISQVPESIPELIDACQILTENGQGGIICDSELYYMLLRTSWLYGIEGYDWLTSFNEGEARMAGTPAEEAWLRLQDILKVSGCAPEDSAAVPASRTNMMLKGEYAFRLTTISNLKYMLRENPDLNLAALPYLGETPGDQWVYFDSPSFMRFFAANASLNLPGNEARKEAVLKILDWITSSDAQNLLAECGSSAVSYVDNVTIEQGDQMNYMKPVIEQGHLTTCENFARGVNSTVQKSVVSILAGELTPAGAVSACDAQNASYLPPQEIPGQDEVIGYARETIYWRKAAAVTVGSAMTQLAAEAMAEAFPEADLAFAMAKNTAATLYEGDITLGDVLKCAKGEQDSELVTIQANGSRIKEVMEMGIGDLTEPQFILPYGIEGAGRLLHPAGLTYEADLTREKGDRITAVTLDSGEALEPEGIYTVVVSRLMADVVAEPNFSDCGVTGTGKFLSDVLTDYIRRHQQISAPEPGFRLLGAPKPLYELP